VEEWAADTLGYIRIRRLDLLLFDGHFCLTSFRQIISSRFTPQLFRQIFRLDYFMLLVAADSS
jgi:hypothetical protein